MGELFLLILGLLLIVKAADVLVTAASSLALRFKVPKMLVALTIMAFGTCAPEVAISFQSVQNGDGQIAFANVIGSTIVNVFLIIGMAALIRPIKVKHATIKKELPILLLVTSVFSILMLDRLFDPFTRNVFSRPDGIVLLLFFSVFVLYLIGLLHKGADETNTDEIKYGSFMSILLIILSLLVTVFSSDLIVNNAVALAEKLNISEKIITMIIIVIGTSLPELVMTVTSARKGEFDMAIGNIVGTNIFNICVVLGLPVAIYGNVGLGDFNFVDIFVVFLSSLCLYLFAKSEKVVSRKEAFIMICIFILYYFYLFIVLIILFL